MIGSKIRKIRQDKEFTLNQVAKATNLTASYLSQIERSITEPSISSLKKIASALNVPIYYFLNEEEKEVKILIKADERKIIKLPNSNIFYEFLTPMPNDIEWPVKFLSGFFEIKPQSTASEDFFIHKADEWLIVLEGELEVILGDQSYNVEVGDSLYIKENIPHKMINNGSIMVKGIFTISPPIYS